MTAIHQLVAGFTRGDAISNEALALRALFRAWGFDSDIFCDPTHTLPEWRRQTRDARDIVSACGPGAVCLLHASIGSEVNARFAALRGRRALLYHNITPASYFELVAPHTATRLARGREELRALAGIPDLALADSAYNAAELESFGFRNVRVWPLLLDFARIRTPPDRGLLRRFQDGLTNVLFVGRCVPNKRIEDLVEVFHVFRRAVEPRARLIHVGAFAGAERYHATVLARVRQLKLDNVVFAGAVSQAQLTACYRAAHVFVSMSEHEGFCIPLLEAMAHDVPVLAFAAAAVPETLDGAGVLLREKRFDLAAEMLGALAREGTLRSAVLRAQRDRLARYEQRDLAAELRGHLAPLLDSAPP